MVISITSSKVNAEQAQKVTAFLKTFLPRMRKFPGVVAIYHYTRPEQGDDSTVVIWESEEAMKAYRQSDLIKEAIAYEKQSGTPATREAHPLQIAL